MNKIIQIVSFVLVFSSCHFDHLYYEMEQKTYIRLNIDWSSSGITPNGASLYVYNQDGSLFKSFPPFSNPYAIELEIPAGNYDLFLHNDIKEELPHLNFANQEANSTFRIEALAEKNEDGSLSEHFFQQPDLLAIGELNAIYIPADSCIYVPEKPIQRLESRVFNYTVTPKQIIPKIQIIVHVKGLRYAAGAPVSSLNNLKDRCYLMNQDTEYALIAHRFILNNRILTPGSTEDGHIMQTITCFGLQKEGTTGYKLQMNFPLINGKIHTITLDVSEQIERVDSLHYRIQTECELPEVISPGTGGSFDTSVEEWEDLEFDIPV